MAVVKKKIQPPKRLQYSEKYAKSLRQPRNHYVMVYMNVDEYGALKERAGSVPMGRFVREIVMRSLSRKKRGV